MLVNEILYECCELVYVNEDGDVLTESEMMEKDEMKDLSAFVAKDGKHYFIDREDIDSGKAVAKPGDTVMFNHDGNGLTAVVSDDARGRDDDVFRLIDVKPLREAAIRQFKKVGGVIKRQYRCLSGPKKGKIVATAQACAQRKDPKKIRHGKKVARQKKGVRVRKTQIAKRKTISKMITRMNRRLSGK